MGKPDAETDSDLIWAAIAGLRLDFKRIEGRIERMSQAEEPDSGKAEEAAEAWRKARQEEIDRLLAVRAAQGKSDELDDEDREELKDAWLCG